MKLVLGILTAATLAGCVIAPVPYAYAQVPPPVCTYNGQVVPCSTLGYDPAYVVYPTYEAAYVWDPVVGCFFFWGGGYRHYMAPGWAWGHGVPHGYWRGNRVWGGGHAYHGGHHR